MGAYASDDTRFCYLDLRREMPSSEALVICLPNYFYDIPILFEAQFIDYPVH